MGQGQILTAIEIKSVLKKVQDAISKPIPSDNAVKAQAKLTYLSGMIGITVVCVADAKRNLLIAQGKAIDRAAKLGLTPMIMKQKVESMCWEEHGLLTECERTNAAITHSGEWLRTVISYAKEELRLTQSQQG